MLHAGARRRRAAVVRDLELPVPFDLEKFVAGLERQRDRPIRLHPFSSRPGCPCGLWIGTADADYIFHDLTCDTTGGLEDQRLADLLVLPAAWPDLHTNRGCRVARCRMSGR
jgi:hypothetical protein